MGEVVFLDAASRRSPPAQQMPYETYIAYRQAETAFRALHLGMPPDPETLTNHPSAEVVQRHWSTVERLAETLRREKSLSREQVLTLLLRASLDAAVGVAS